MKNTLQICCVGGILLFALILFPLSSIAGIVELIPGIQIAAEYDDNIDFTDNSSEADDDVSGKAVPNVQLKYKTERLDLTGQAQVDFKKYLNQTEYDRTNQLYSIGTIFQAHRRWILSGNYTFRRDETIDTQYEETGRAFERKRAIRHDAQAGILFALTELSDIGPVINYRRADYNGRDNTDYDYYQIELPYTKKFKNQIDTISIKPMYTRNSVSRSTWDQRRRSSTK